MDTARRAAGTLAVVALSFVVGLVWLAAQDDRAGRVRADAGVVEGGAASAATDRTSDVAAPAAARPGRRRAHVRTDEDVRRDAAREELVAAVEQARSNIGAANVRRMVLPGASTATAEVRLDAPVRLTASVPTAAVLALDDSPTLRVSHDVRQEREIRPFISEDWRTTSFRVRSTLFDDGPEGFGPDDAGDTPDPRRHGLRADYFDFLEGGLEDVPDLASLPPSFSRVDPAIEFATDASFALPFDPETFGALWRGYLVVETAGEHEFTVGSDDGARLRIDGETLLEFRALRPYAETSAKIHLEPGRHRFELGFYENYVFASCRLFWKTPGAAERRIVPATAFEPPDEIAAVDPPHLTRVFPEDGRIGDEVAIWGSGFSPTASLQRVTFAGVPAEVVEASPTELIVKVPIGASTGNVVVQVGPLSTRPLPFRVDNVLGLYGEYFLIGTDIADLPDFDTIAPYFVRLDGPLDFVEDGLWQMPYEPDVFAVRWFGYLYVPEEDDYEIALMSDDGAYVAIDGTKVVDLPGLHPPAEAASVVALTAGFHPIELRFFENYGLARLRLSWRRRGEPTRVPIPRGFLFAPDALAQRAGPDATHLEPAKAVSGDEIVVRGRGFGTDPRIVRVEFPGGVWVRPSVAADDELRVRVPHGVGTGDVRVHVGVHASGRVAFELGEPIGLRGDYFELTSGEAARATDLPGLLANRTPTLTRTDTRWRFGRREAWDLPFADRDFAARWTGTICVETSQNLLVALQSESAAILRIDGTDILVDGDPHKLREAFGAGRLTPGEHAIELVTLHRAGDTPQLHVFVTPWGRADHLEFPPTWLRPRPPR